MNLILTIIILCFVVYGIYWAYPRLPTPFNWILAAIVGLVCVVILLNLSGVAHVQLPN